MRVTTCVVMMLGILACGPTSRAQTDAATSVSTAPTAHQCIDAVVDSLIHDMMHRRNVAGASIAVRQAGRLLKQDAFGIANLSTNEPVEEETAFFIASITKAFTAVAAMALVQQGLLQLDRPITGYMDELPRSWNSITVRHLLVSTSGLPEPWIRPGTALRTLNALLDSIRNKPLLTPPGATFRYESPNYELLGEIIRRVSGKPFSRFVQDRLLNPSEIRTAKFGDYRIIDRSFAEWYSTMHVTSDWRVADTVRHVLRTDYPEYRFPSAGMHISAPELVRWMSDLGSGRVICKDLVDTLFSPILLSNGTLFNRPFGAWFLESDSAGQWLSLSGGARASMAYWREGDLAVAILTNTQGASPNAKTVARLYAGRAEGKLRTRCPTP